MKRKNAKDGGAKERRRENREKSVTHDGGYNKGKIRGGKLVRGINYGIGNILGTGTFTLYMRCSAHIVIGLKLRTCNSPFRRNGNNTAISRPTALPGSIRRKKTVHK